MKGQGAIEYLLLVGAAVTIATVVGYLIKTNVLSR
jgi:uncharacterized protein (UPF0333 family)